VCGVHVERIGFTPVKGGRHRTQESVTLAVTGPVGDRRFCLVDPAVDRCLRTVENPTLLQTSASWDGEVLSVDVPGGTMTGAPLPTGEVRTVDYWGRVVTVELVEGPWAAAYSTHLGREVVLAGVAPGEVVYGSSVTLVTNASLARLSELVGERVDGARFRATFQVAGGELSPHEEDDWVGRRLRLGTAEVEVRGVVPRCAVIDLDPASGARDLSLMSTLAEYRPGRGEIAFGIDAVVTVPGRVRTADPVGLTDD
jgi:uncharacterized protein YcbX